MLNEKRVKHMVKLASFDNKDGAKEVKISSYFKKDYLSYNVWISLFWATLGYGLLATLLCFTYLPQIVAKLEMLDMVLIVLAIILGYLLCLIFYGVMASRLYRKKHYVARSKVKAYLQDLDILEKMYEREETS